MIFVIFPDLSLILVPYIVALFACLSMVMYLGMVKLGVQPCSLKCHLCMLTTREMFSLSPDIFLGKQNCKNSSKI